MAPTPGAPGRAPACERRPRKPRAGAGAGWLTAKVDGQGPGSPLSPEPREHAPQGVRGTGSCGFPARRVNRGRPSRSAAAAERVAHPRVTADLCPPPHLPLGRARLRPGPREDPPPPFSGARPGSARGARRVRPGDTPATPAAIDCPAAWRGGGTGSESRARHAAAYRTTPPRLPLSPKVQRANYCKLKLIKLLFPFPSPWERWRDPAPAGGLTPSGHPAGRRQGPGEGEGTVVAGEGCAQEGADCKSVWVSSRNLSCLDFFLSIYISQCLDK